MNIKAVIFDMDGVIIDSEPLYRKIQDKIFKDLGFSVSDVEYDTFIGLGLKKMWKRLIVSRNLKQSIEYLIELNNQQIHEYFKEEKLEPMSDFIEFLDLCLSKKMKTAVASSTSKIVIDTILRKLGVMHKIPIIVSGEEVPAGKPAPDIFLEAADRLNISPANCIVIEDSENGVKAAKSARMYCIGLQNPNSGKQDLSAADKIINSFKEIKLEYVS